VGTLLQWEAIRHAILAGCRDYDFLRGAEEYKTHWGTEARRHVRIRLTRSSTKVRLLRVAAGLARRRPDTPLGRWARRLGS
jgi:CelD/BcsL family acetyltransferase involved in cellulose biosynthesis